MKSRAIKIWNKITPLVKFGDVEIHNNGDNNLYPNECGLIISQSTTASGAVDVMTRFITPQVPEIDPVINVKKEYRLSDLERLISQDIAIYGGSFIWVGLGIDEEGNIVPKTADVLDYEKCRIQRADDIGNEGDVIYRDWAEKEGFGLKKKKNKFIRFRPYKSNQAFLKAEILAEGNGDIALGIKEHKGMVYFLNPSNLIYPNTPFHSALKDCETEAGISIYSNTNTEAGFLGKVLFLTQGLDDDELDEVETVIKDTLGTDSVGNVGLLSFGQGTDIDSVVKIITVPSIFNDKEFSDTSIRVKENILSAAFNLPKPLVYSGDGAMFGTSGDVYKQYVDFYSENTKYYREKIKKVTTHLGFRHIL